MTDSTFKILLTTDNHLGFAERDPRRGDDSFTTFEEVLRAARTEHDVDFMLLGGDLFHENKPSLGCLVRACSLFRKYVYGNKGITFSLLSDPAINFPTHALPMANFQDPNINVALPVFAIHGNHDDPVGGTSSLDLLATNGYLNYFGHVTSVEDIVVEPILLRKGNTFIALYGLGNVRDERLHRCFRLKKVQFIYPKPVPGRKWFNILLLHQNRGVRGVASKNGILESMLAGFGMDLVIWGNEHEQLMVPQPSDGFDVIQPGSTILTSLSAQECNPKQYGILEVRGTSYRLTPYPLRSVRPVVRRTVELREDLPGGRTLDAVETFLHGVMAEMIDEAEGQVAHIPDDVLSFHPSLKYPLVRLAVDFSDVTSAPYPQPNFNRFGQQYVDVVANPGEVLRPVKPKPERRAPGTVLGPGGAGTGGVVVPTAPQLNTLDIRVKVAEVFNHNAKSACTLLSELELSAAVYAFAEKGERDAIDERLMELLHASQKSVWRRMESGASDGILNPSRVVEEVATHKRHVNERYARAAQFEDAELQRLQERNCEVEDDNVNAEGARAAATATILQAGHRQRIDAFETVRAAPPVIADHSDSGNIGSPRATRSSAFGDDENDFGGQVSVSTLVQEAIRRDETIGNVTRTATNKRPKAPVAAASKPDNAGFTNEEADDDDGGEELPDDGLDRVSLDSIVAQAVQQQQEGVTKRSRSNTSNPLPAEVDKVDPEHNGPFSNSGFQDGDGDDDDDNGDVEIIVEDGDENVGNHGSSSGGGGDGARGRNKRATNHTSTANTASSTARKKPRTTSARGGRSGAAVSRRGGGNYSTNTVGAGNSNNNSGGPTLTFVAHQGSSVVGSGIGGVSNAQIPLLQPLPQQGQSSASSSRPILDLLSRWTGGTLQQH